MYCGHENEDSLVSCSVCGNKLGISFPTQEPVTVEEAASQAGMTDEAVNAADTAGAEASASVDPVAEAQRAADEAMVTQEPAFAGQVPVNRQFSENTPAGQFSDGENTYASSNAQGAGQYGENAYAAQDGQAAQGAGQYGESFYGSQGGQAAPGAGQYGESFYGSQGGQTAPGAGQYGENAYAAQNGQTAPGAGQYGENSYAAQNAQYSGADMTPGYGEDWRQDVGRGQTYGARTQYEARREARRAQNANGSREGVTGGVYNGNGQYEGAQNRDQYGRAGYGYRQPGQDPQAKGGRSDYGRRESSGGSKTFMVKARKRVKSVSFVLMALAFTAMLALNVYNIYCGNALRNITDSKTMLANILSGTDANFFTQMLTELASQMVNMITNIRSIVSSLGQSVELGIAIVFLVPNVLYCLALWLMFFRTDTKRRQFPMGGYTMARVMMILKFLIACLVLAVGLVISVYFVVVGAQKKSGTIDSSLIQGVILLIVMIVVSIFVVMYYIQWMFCLKVVRDNAKKGTDPGRMPGFVVFLSLLCTGVCIALMIPMASNDYVGLAARAAAAAYFLTSGLWVMLYKIKVKRT